MVELEHDRIALAAVDAGAATQVGDQVFGPFGDDGPLANPCLLDVSPAVEPVVLLLVERSAGRQ
jgi:hypothetical protein